MFPKVLPKPRYKLALAPRLSSAAAEVGPRMMKAVVTDKVSAADQAPKRSDDPQVGPSAFVVDKAGGSTSHLPRPAKVFIDKDSWWSVPPCHKWTLEDYDVGRMS